MVSVYSVKFPGLLIVLYFKSYTLFIQVPLKLRCAFNFVFTRRAALKELMKVIKNSTDIHPQSLRNLTAL